MTSLFNVWIAVGRLARLTQIDEFGRTPLRGATIEQQSTPGSDRQINLSRKVDRLGFRFSTTHATGLNAVERAAVSCSTTLRQAASSTRVPLEQH